MHRKGIFALAGVFLAIALTVPPAILIIQTSQQIQTYSAPNNPGHQTSGNFSAFDPISSAEILQTAYIIAGVIEAVFVILFVITLYYGVNHPHSSHARTEITTSDI